MFWRAKSYSNIEGVSKNLFGSRNKGNFIDQFVRGRPRNRNQGAILIEDKTNNWDQTIGMSDKRNRSASRLSN